MRVGPFPERARATARVAWFELLEERRAALLAVQKQFYRILRLEQAAALAREETRLAEELAGLGRAMAKEERIDRIELNTQEVAARRAEMAVRELERRHRRACLELDGLLGAPAGTTAGVQGGWPGPARGTPVTVAGGTLADHPRRRAREAAVAAGRKSLAEADSLAWPDLELYALGLHDEFQEEDYFGLGFGLPLPLFDRNQGGRAAARAGLIRARRALAAECARLAAELAAAQSDLARARELAALYDEEILPRLEENCALVAERVARGRASRLEELRSRLLLLAARREVLTHRQEQAAARSEIDYLMAE